MIAEEIADISEDAAEISEEAAEISEEAAEIAEEAAEIAEEAADISEEAAEIGDRRRQVPPLSRDGPTAARASLSHPGRRRLPPYVNLVFRPFATPSSPSTGPASEPNRVSSRLLLLLRGPRLPACVRSVPIFTGLHPCSELHVRP